jgi:uncharacterized cupredoxin-like copper-binding protein
MRLLVLSAALPLLVVACGSDGGEGDVNVTLSDFAVELDPATATAGDVVFVASNEGAETHEFEIFRIEGDTDPTALPVEDNVADTEGLTLLDEVEDVTPGGSAELTVNLDAGAYAVICNLPGHYAQGMFATLDVE